MVTHQLCRSRPLPPLDALVGGLLVSEFPAAAACLRPEYVAGGRHIRVVGESMQPTVI